MENNQLSFYLVDEVAPYFDRYIIKDLCVLIDLKARQGVKYNDLKAQLLQFIRSEVDLNNPADSFNIYRRAYEFAKYY
jgi:hypothetical protein